MEHESSEHLLQNTSQVSGSALIQLLTDEKKHPEGAFS